MDSEKYIKDKLLKILKKYCFYEKNEIDISIDLLNDLGCGGDDAYELIEKICQEFKINCQEFEPYDVTDSEALDYRRSLLNPFYLYKSFFDKEKTKRPKLTIGILLKAIKKKKLKSIKPKGYYYAKEIIVENEDIT